MTDIMHIPHKSGKQFLFEVKLNWLEDNRGILHAHDVDGTLHVATPQTFGGEGRQWSPEHLFISSISSCYMSTFLLFAKKINLHLSHFECNVIGQIELVDGKYKFTHINLYPKIYISDNDQRANAIETAQKTQRYCLTSNSVNATVIYHTEILHEKHHTPGINEI